MSKNKKQRYDGVVYSTDSDFSYAEDNKDEFETLPNDKQLLKIFLDKKSRKGKVVTIVDGFIGSNDDLVELSKILKQKCGVGGSAKDGEVLIQGDFKAKISEILNALGYRVKCI